VRPLGTGARALWLAVALAAPLEAQFVARGRVTSAADGRAIAEAEVRLEGADTLYARTDGSGAWVLRPARSGRYQMRVRALGYVAQVSAVEVGVGPLDDLRAALVPAALPLDQMVVTAARRAQRLGDAVTTVEVVSREDIERTGASDLASVLTEHTGIELQGGHPAGAGVMLQGIGTERVLVLLDGQPVAGRISGGFDISRIPAAMVERIEVVKGAQSTLYGSEAMGGVVNIITRTPPSDAGLWGGTVSATAGGQGRRDGAGRLTLSHEAWAASADVARRRVTSAPGVADADGALAARVDGALKVRWSPDSTRHAEVSLLALDERQRWRSGSFYSITDNVQVTARIGSAWRVGAHRFAPGFAVSHYDHTAYTSAFPLPVAGDPGDRQMQRVLQGEFLYAGAFGAALAVDAGVQVRVDEIESTRVPGGLRSHRSLEPFAQVDVALHRRVHVVPGVRLSHSTVWGNELTPRLAMRASLSDRLTLRASVGDGFRAPDFKELYLFFQNTSAGYAVQGNAALRPERSRNAMLGLEYVMATGYVRGQLFQNAFRDFIETQVVSAPDAPPVYEYANRDRGWTRGAEFEAGANLVQSGRVRGELGLTLLRTRDEATGVALLARPAQSARASASVALPFDLRGSVTLLHTGRTAMQRDAESGRVTSWRDAFSRVDVRIARTIVSLGVDAVLGADNLFDRRPAEWAGFTGRHIYGSLSYSFNRPTY
jgi:outer membrane receptor for ferrienterochelin and colicins